MAQKPRSTKKPTAKKKPAAKKPAPEQPKAATDTAPQDTADPHPIQTLRDEVNRLFEGFEKGLDWWSRERPFDIEPFVEPFKRMEPFAPGKRMTADVDETDEAFRVTAELPGLEEKDVEVTLAEGLLTIKAEKSEAEEDKDRHVSERRYGLFSRSFSLPKTVDTDKAEARMKNGVLSVVLPKRPETETAAKKVKISKG